MVLKNFWLCPITKAVLWNANKGGGFPCFLVWKHTPETWWDTHAHIFQYTKHIHLWIPLMRVWTALGGRILQVAALSSTNDWICLCLRSYGPEREVCVPRHTLPHFLITHTWVFSLFRKTYWHVSIQQARYRTNEQFYHSLYSGKSIPLNIGKSLFGPVSLTQSGSHFEMMVTRAINHSPASHWPITFSSLN